MPTGPLQEPSPTAEQALGAQDLGRHDTSGHPELQHQEAHSSAALDPEEQRENVQQAPSHITYVKTCLQLSSMYFSDFRKKEVLRIWENKGITAHLCERTQPQRS